MPTGYTAGVEDGTVTELREYALLCARAFGATIMLRDDPLAPAPERIEPDTRYNDNAISEAEAELARLDAMSSNERRSVAAAALKAAEAQHTTRVARAMEERRRHEVMRDAVEAWKEPSVDHVELKAFMLQQLAASTWDWSDPLRFITAPKPENYEPDAWFAEQRRRVVDRLARARTNRAEEIQRAQNRNDWLAALYASLPPAREIGGQE